MPQADFFFEPLGTCERYLVAFGECIFSAGEAIKQAHSGATQLFYKRSQRGKDAAQSDKLSFTRSLTNI